MNLAALVVSALAIWCMTLRDQSKQEVRLFKQMTQGIDDDTKRFLCDHECKVSPSPRREVRGPSQWTYAMLKCRNLEFDHIPVVICDKYCVNPLDNCRALRKYINVPVYFTLSIKNRSNGTSYVQIPVACQCQLRKTRPTCSNQRRKPQ